MRARRLGQLAPDLIHVDLARPADQILEWISRDGSRLAVQDNLITHDYHGRVDMTPKAPARSPVSTFAKTISG
jgi:hypothetical protein